MLCRLRSSEAFQSANAILSSPVTTMLHHAIVLAIVQWGEATQIGPTEVQLRNFLSVFDVLFDVDSHDDALDLIALLICRSDKRSIEPDTVKEILDELYLVRDRLLHEGFDPSCASSVVCAEDVYIARHFGRQAILNALLYHYRTANKRDLVRELKKLVG